MGKRSVVGVHSGYAWAILPAFPFIVMFAAAVVGHGSAPATPVHESAIGWDVADQLVESRSEYWRALGHGEAQEWSGYAPAYFRALAERRASVMAWSASLPRRPSVVFVGVLHLSVAGGESPEKLDEIRRIQRESFERVRAQAVDASVIAIEDEGSDEVITPEVSIDLMRRSLAHDHGMHLSDAEILELTGRDPQPSTRAIMELTTPVIYGEEWPLHLETHIIRRGFPSDRQELKSLGMMLLRFDRLRSEIILIRTLEFLRRVGGVKGVIIQGDGHRAQVASLAESYHISFLGIPVD